MPKSMSTLMKLRETKSPFTLVKSSVKNEFVSLCSDREGSWKNPNFG